MASHYVWQAPSLGYLSPSGSFPHPFGILRLGLLLLVEFLDDGFLDANEEVVLAVELGDFVVHEGGVIAIDFVHLFMLFPLIGCHTPSLLELNLTKRDSTVGQLYVFMACKVVPVLQISLNYPFANAITNQKSSRILSIDMILEDNSSTEL